MNPNAVTRGFQPELYDASVLRTLEDNLVMNSICKAKIKAPIKEYGDTVYFTDLADPTITDYVGSLTAEDLKDSQISMLINKTKTFCYKVNDIDNLMNNLDVEGSQSQRAAYMLKRAMEVDVFTNVGAKANAGTALAATITSANIVSQLGELALMLEDNNVAPENMFCLIPPWMRLYLKETGIVFQINTGLNGSGGMAWTDELGFKVFVSNTVYNSGTQASPVSTVLAGSYQAIGFEKKMLSTRSIELSASRNTQLDGGAIYGYEVIKPKELAKAVFTKGAQTAI